MNDLAEKALQGLDAARRQVTGRPATSLAVAGFVVSSAVVVAGGLVSAQRPTRSLTSWLGLEDSPSSGFPAALPAWLLLVGIVVLALLWVGTLVVVHRTRQRVLRVWVLAGAWAAPFAIGPPLMDTTAYSSAAYGFVQRAGRDPYTSAPTSLGNNPIVDAIDPASRDTVSAAGPLGSMLHHLAVSTGGGSALASVIVLRVVGVVAAIAIGRFALELAGHRRADVLALCVLNPLVLLYVVSSPHLDGPMIALVLASLAAARQRRWLVAVTLACLAGAVLPQAFVLVPVLLLVHLRGRRSAPVWRVLGRDLGVAAAVTLAVGLLQPDGFGWIGAVSEQFSTHTPYSVANAVGQVLNPIVTGASFDDLLAGGRITAATAAVCAIAYLIVTARHRPIERTTGYALLTLALLAPNLYPWYLLWGVLCLVPTATGERRVALVGLCVAGCVLAPAGFGTTTAGLVTAAGLVIVAAVTGAVLLHQRRARDVEAELSAGA